MPQLNLPLFSNNYLAGCWMGDEYRDFVEQYDREFLERLRHWVAKDIQKETTAESTFVEVFFKRTWGYRASGEGPRAEGYTCRAQSGVVGAGQSGGIGEADLALGLFDNQRNLSDIPQAMCEFKGISRDLDKPQNRKNDTRPPVKQCFDYLKNAEAVRYGHEAIRPTWGIVTNMDEFRLYHFRTGPSQYQRFSLSRIPGAEECWILGDDEDCRFRRFIFWKMFQQDLLLSVGGQSPLESILSEQWVHEKNLEKDFYKEYHTFRESVYHAIVSANPAFPGTRGTLVRLTQRFLDRCIFLLCCEDMGAVLNFPKDLLRDLLAEISTSRFFNTDDNIAWGKVKLLFTAMRDGGTPFGNININRFNGGLFEEDPLLDNLIIPTRVFCGMGQGKSEESLRSNSGTLLYFAAIYNLGVDEGGKDRAIGLYTLGRIFEQSITDLEKMEARAEGRVSIAELSKRKSDGVYYTPEWVTEYIVKEVVGTRLHDLRSEIGLPEIPPFSEDDLEAYRNGNNRNTNVKNITSLITKYTDKLDVYAEALENVKIVDPACGSGAFLIQAFNYLLNERKWIANERSRIRQKDMGMLSLFDLESEMRSVLTNNIFGVDINPESVEITKLALWLRTALPDRPLSMLDENIRCGNSLVGPDFYPRLEISLSLFDENKKEQINAFDWQLAFSKIFIERGGFDCVVGNPPYVKLQNLKIVQPEVAEYLSHAKNGSGPKYASTQTSNFDLYLPFIERGLSLLNPKGRMGFIAPNVWAVNEYGQGLRAMLANTRQLERWVDFKSYQVFEEAITYTALQFFTASANESVQCILAPNGQSDFSTTEWKNANEKIPYAELLATEPWRFMTNDERTLLKKLKNTSITLEDSCTGIIVGIQTSADEIYHLERLAPGRYLQHINKELSTEIEIEDALMHPLVSGQDTKRYQTPNTHTYLLFPYDLSGQKPCLLTKQAMITTFPKAWLFLTSHEKALRAREKGKMNKDDSWWAYNYPKNLAKQEMPKLMIPRLVDTLACSIDAEGIFYMDNVDVNGIIANNNRTLFFLAGVLNSPIANFVWRLIAKPFQNDYRSANKQFIAPLPIPVATSEEQSIVGQWAKELQSLTTEMRDVHAKIADILARATEAWLRKPEWLWPDVHDIAYWKNACQAGMKGAELTNWAKQQWDKAIEMHLNNLRARLFPSASFDAESTEGRLTLLIDGVPVIIAYPDATQRELDFVALQWRYRARSKPLTESTTARQLLDRLLTLRRTDNASAYAQLVQMESRVTLIEKAIDAKEREINDLIANLFGLSQEERQFIEGV